MKVALVAPSRSRACRARELADALREELAAHCELATFVAGGAQSDELDVLELDPRAHDRLLVPVSNEVELAYAPSLVRRLGGAVVLLDWSLETVAREAYPELRAGGLRGSWVAWREGGAEALRSPGSATLNRSVVRFGDSFFVPTMDVKRQVLVERNAATPVAVLDGGLEPGGPGGSGSFGPEHAQAMFEALERMPAHRTAKKTSLVTRVRQELALRRQERAELGTG